MGLESRGDNRYYYRKRWQDGRCVSEYIGGGLRAEHTALIDAIERACDAEALQAERAALAATSAQHAAMDAPIDELSSLLQRLTRAVLLTNGYHLHKGTWRRKLAVRANVAGLVDVSKEERSQMMSLLQRVDAPHPSKEDTTALREALSRYPSLWRVVGDLSTGVIGHTIDALQGPLSMKESMDAGIKAMRLELGGADPPMLERLLIDQILTCWLRQAEAEYKYTEVVRDAGDHKAIYWEKRLTQTQKRYLRAITR